MEHPLLREDSERQRKGQGQRNTERRAKEETETQAREDSKATDPCVEKQDAGQASATRRWLISETKARTTSIKVKTTRRHEQPEEETDIRTCDMCAVEDVEESKGHASKSATKIRKMPATGLTPAIMLKQCEEIMANLKESTKQRNEAHEHKTWMQAPCGQCNVRVNFSTDCSVDLEQPLCACWHLLHVLRMSSLRLSQTVTLM